VAPHRGAQSPLKPIEEYIISMLNQMAKMRQPLCVSEGLALANALIEGTEWEQRLRDFKTKRGWQQLDEEGKMKPLLGKKWCRGFFKRNFRTRRIQVVSGSAESADQLQEAEDTRANLLNKWAEIKHRETPPPSPVRDEDDSSDEENNIEVAPV